MSILLIFTFYDVWDDYFFKNNLFIDLINSQEFIVSAIITILTSAVLILRWIKYKEIKIDPLEPLFLVFYILFYIGLFGYYPVFIINLIVFAIGIYTIWDGVKKNHLGILNFGLLIITALVICRFFDTELSFIYRGIMFISVGFGFFITNYKLLQKRKSINSKSSNNEI
jgi:tellurite resistance protein TehA-like permease